MSFSPLRTGEQLLHAHFSHSNSLLTPAHRGTTFSASARSVLSYFSPLRTGEQPQTQAARRSDVLLTPAHRGTTRARAGDVSVYSSHPCAQGNNDIHHLDIAHMIFSPLRTEEQPASRASGLHHLLLTPAHRGTTFDEGNRPRTQPSHPCAQGNDADPASAASASVFSPLRTGERPGRPPASHLP